MALYHLGVAVALESFAVAARCGTYVVSVGLCGGCRDNLWRRISNPEPEDPDNHLGVVVWEVFQEYPVFTDWLLENL